MSSSAGLGNATNDPEYPVQKCQNSKTMATITLHGPNMIYMMA
jgi:hypothetical protein